VYCVLLQCRHAPPPPHSLHLFQMNMQIANSATLKNIRLAKIHREVAEVFGEGSVRKWCRLFEASRYNVHDEKHSGGPVSGHG